LKRSIRKIIILLIFTQSFLISTCLILTGKGTPIQTDVGFGKAPEIDGVLDLTNNEWGSAIKLNFDLLQDLENENETDGLPIDFWILQTEPSPEIYNVDFLIRFDLNDHSSSEYNNEFVGILIAGWDDPLNFTDAKIVQFSNISANAQQYLDYYIKDNVYYQDTVSNGEGVAKLDGNEIVYEFSIPVEEGEGGVEDVELEHLAEFDFKIVYGKTPIYPDGIIVSNIVSIYLDPPPPTAEDISELIILVSTIIVFSAIGAFYVFYLYRITQLKKKIERIRS
jgi:hypothetical protein